MHLSTSQIDLEMNSGSCIAQPPHISEGEATMRREFGRHWRWNFYPGLLLGTYGLTCLAVYIGHSQNSLRDGLVVGILPMGVGSTIPILEIFTRCGSRRTEV